MNELIWGIILLVVGIAWLIYELNKKDRDFSDIFEIQWIVGAALSIISGIVALLKYFL